MSDELLSGGREPNGRLQPGPRRLARSSPAPSQRSLPGLSQCSVPTLPASCLLATRSSKPILGDQLRVQKKGGTWEREMNKGWTKWFSVQVPSVALLELGRGNIV